MKAIHDEKGRFIGISKRNDDGSDTFFGPGSNRWQDFLDWNAKQPVPLDLSDKPPEPVPVDVYAERIKEILAKRDIDITAAEVKEAVLKFLRKTVR